MKSTHPKGTSHAEAGPLLQHLTERGDVPPDPMAAFDEIVKFAELSTGRKWRRLARIKSTATKDARSGDDGRCEKSLNRIEKFCDNRLPPFASFITHIATSTASSRQVLPDIRDAVENRDHNLPDHAVSAFRPSAERALDDPEKAVSAILERVRQRQWANEPEFRRIRDTITKSRQAGHSPRRALAAVASAATGRQPPARLLVKCIDEARAAIADGHALKASAASLAAGLLFERLRTLAAMEAHERLRKGGRPRLGSVDESALRQIAARRTANGGRPSASEVMQEYLQANRKPRGLKTDSFRRWIARQLSSWVSG